MRTSVLTLSLVLFSAGCTEDVDQLHPGARGGSADPNLTNGADGGAANPSDPAQCGSRPYVGFGGRNLVQSRVVALAGTDRGRMKPFEALASEYTRVLGGTAPRSLAGAGPTFGQVAPRWFEEPTAGAVALQTAYEIAFEGCLGWVARQPGLSAAPTAATASDQCSSMARAFWSKTPTPEEINACADVAVTGTASEPNARRRWAYACGAVLTAAGFLTY